MKRQIIAVSLLMVASSVQFANAAASDGTINFTGAITAQTCTINVNNNGSSPSVILPTVSTAGMNAAGLTKGSTALNFALTACAGTASNASVFFQGGPGVTVNGTVANTAPIAVAATGIALQINDSNNSPVTIGSSNQLTSGLTPIATGNASMAYTVQYVTTNPTPTAGMFAGAVMYSINYQ